MLTHDLCTVKEKWFEPVQTSSEGFVRVLFRPIAFAMSDHEMDLKFVLGKPYLIVTLELYALTRKLR